MPKEKWTGYERSCPFAKGLDVIGERWTLLIIHELFGGGLRYGELNARLPGISTNVLADRLRKLEDASVIGRAVGDPGDGVRYELTDRGHSTRQHTFAHSIHKYTCTIEVFSVWCPFHDRQRDTAPHPKSSITGLASEEDPLAHPIKTRRLRPRQP